MTNIRYRIVFYSYWHAGSGLTSGSDLDSLVIKDQHKLPFIPGKTLKGLLKEAAEKIQALKQVSDPAFIGDVFGIGSDANEEISNMGGSHFSNAELPSALISEILSSELQQFLYNETASTAIDENGTARKHSLRRMQVTIPLTLEASILNIHEKYIKDISECLMWIKRMGQGRNRGLGRCKFELIKEGGAL